MARAVAWLKVGRAVLSGFLRGPWEGGARMALMAAVLAVFLASSVAIASDTHDFQFPQTKCSVCEAKKVCKGTWQKASQDVEHQPSSLWAEGVRIHSGFHFSLTERVQPLSVALFREADRAPPTFS